MRDKFKLLVHESIGQSYEDLFVKIMTYADTCFKPVKAHGNIGDRSNDGWNSLNGRYYQSYAPENLPENTDKAVNKLNEDFRDLKAYWGSISSVKEFYFVLNDKFKGASPHIISALNDIKNEHNLTVAEVFLASDLERTLFDLPHDQIEQILGSKKVNATQNSENDFYKYIVDVATNKLHLSDWIRISDNLIACSIEDFLIDDFNDFTTLIFRTEFPSFNKDLDNAIIELSNRTQALIDHFTKSPHAYLTDDFKWWRKDLRWKKTWYDQKTYEIKWNESELWRKKLLNNHINFVHALNIYSTEVKNSINPIYFMNQSFVISDSLGVHNNMQGYQYIPKGFVEVN